MDRPYKFANRAVRDADLLEHVAPQAAAELVSKIPDAFRLDLDGELDLGRCASRFLGFLCGARLPIERKPKAGRSGERG